MRQSDCRRHPQSAYQKVETAITPTRQSACVYYAIEIRSPQLVDYLRTNQLRFFHMCFMFVKKRCCGIRFSMISFWVAKTMPIHPWSFQPR